MFSFCSHLALLINWKINFPTFCFRHFNVFEKTAVWWFFSLLFYCKSFSISSLCLSVYRRFSLFEQNLIRRTSIQLAPQCFEGNFLVLDNKDLRVEREHIGWKNDTIFFFALCFSFLFFLFWKSFIFNEFALCSISFSFIFLLQAFAFSFFFSHLSYLLALLAIF